MGESTVEGTIAEMESFVAPASPNVTRVLTFDTRDVAAALRSAGVPESVLREVVTQWNAFRDDDVLVPLLSSLVEWVERTRGDVDAPIPIWDELDAAGTNGRFFYFYLFALCYDATREFLRHSGCPNDVIEMTMSAVPRHTQIHQRRFGSAGIYPGWWLLPILRGEMVQIESLKFHRVNLSVGNLSPEPWYSNEESNARGTGFRRGDPSVGLHIPVGTALNPDAIDRTFAHAREVIAEMWPVTQRRLATLQSWLLDDQLKSFLSPDSNIMKFQQRFTLLDGWYDNDEETLGFIFQSPGVAIDDLARDTSLERGVLGLLERGGHWRARPGWLDFDGR
jgi:hypothetical protein